MAGDPGAAWRALNDRQRAYLAAAYALDQEHEAAERSAGSRAARRRPADEWRWLDYGEVYGGPSALLTRIRLRGVADPLPAVRLTPLGRWVARAGLGESAPERSAT